MTGAQIDRVSVPSFVTASAVLLRLAHPFFQGGIVADHSDGWAEYGTWLVLRETAQFILDRRAIELTVKEALLFRCALDLCPEGEDVAYLRSLDWTVRRAA